MTDITPSPLRIGRVALTVHDLDGIAEFYRTAIGLDLLSRDGEAATLGAGGVPLLELRRDAAARRHEGREAGLFHTAFLLPDRADLGRWLGQAAEQGLRLHGAADHGVSEALYLSDPEGNGIEIYADRPRAAWTRHGDLIEMPNDRIDLPALVAAGAGQPWRGAPEGSTVGHVHLQVGDLPQAEIFYRDRLGMAVTWRYEKASFYGSGGYHHHLATNVWNSRGAPVRQGPATGLAEVELLARDAAVLDALRDDGAAPGADGGVLLHDPWGTALSARIG